MYTTLNKITDGGLAAASVLGTNTIIGEITPAPPNSNSIITQILLPVVTGILVPFLKDLTLKLNRKRREKKGLINRK